MFDIFLTEEVVPESDDRAVYGRIRLGNHTQTFVTSLVSWSRDQYEQHWREACKRLIEGMPDSALISSYVEPAESEFLNWWPLYRDGAVVHVRNEILVYSQLIKRFTIDDPWSAIRERRTLTDQGLEISEWDIPIQSIDSFLKRVPHS